jgi:hypothetical protein
MQMSDTFKATVVGQQRMLLFGMIDAAWKACYTAATKEGSDYDAAEYDRLWRVADALTMAWCEGDEAWAKALHAAWVDSQESITWYTTQYTRDQLVYHFNTYEKADETALEHRLGQHDARTSEWTDECDACKAALG